MNKHLILFVTFILLSWCSTKEQKNIACTQEIDPVCTQVTVPCENEPCSTTQKEFTNACLAEKENATIVFEWTCAEMLEAKKQEIADKVIIISPEANSVVTSPISLSGEAPGNWFFEATAPVRLLDSMWVIIAQGYITAEWDRMTTNQVPFSGTLEFQLQWFLPSKNWTLIFQAQNASWEEEFDIEISLPVRFE